MQKTKSIGTLILAVLFFSVGYSQSSTISIDTNRLKTQAMQMAESFVKADYKAFVKYTYPKVIQMVGGETNMINLVKDQITQLANQGYTITSIDIELTPARAKAGKEIHAILKQSLLMIVPGGSLIATSYLLGVTPDAGKQWYFVDTTPLKDKAKLKALFPNFNPGLKIPDKEAPVFTKAQ